MAGKRSHEDLEEDGTNTSQTSTEDTNLDVDELLKDDDPSSQKQVPELSRKTNDTLEATLANLNNNMLTMVNSLGSMSKALERFTDRPRPSKRHKRDDLSDLDTHSNEEVKSSDDDSEALLEETQDNGEDNCPTQGTKDDLLDNIANDLNADEQTYPDVSDKLAKIVNKRWSEKFNPDKLSEKMKKYSRPGNSGNLAVPRVNPEIWANMNHIGKRADIRAAITQNIVSKVGSILAKCTDTLLTARNDKKSKEINLDEMIGFHTDALALLGHTQYELSMKRRDAIKPSLNKEYAGLCSQMYQLRPFCLATNFNNSSITSKLPTKSRKLRRAGTNHSEVLIKVPLLITGSEGLQTSTTGGLTLLRTIGKIGGRSQKT